MEFSTPPTRGANNRGEDMKGKPFFQKESNALSK